MPTNSPHSHAHSHFDSRIEVDTTHRQHSSAIDIAEREYRSRIQPNYRDEVDVIRTTVDAPRASSTFHEDIKVTEQTVDFPRRSHHKSKMGYYDENGKLYSAGCSSAHPFDFRLARFCLPRSSQFPFQRFQCSRIRALLLALISATVCVFEMLILLPRLELFAGRSGPSLRRGRLSP